ncbi:site-specific DNA-methyltransferase [Mammaliicoccus sciuri]|uniref:Methyltransferase n=1 Tax=Mammaliicoccus sciuri TaxID=1296 RepID=A0AAJ4SJZ3_MAMSC|nr:DNA methyltransferase [Mammaliicoccus sciuri]RTX75017.1 site-specific DNA-methyltransferase [Mammaliicoccus sciuri]
MNIDEILYYGNSLDFYHTWERPKVIISDGPYGVSGYKGDTHSPELMIEDYELHIKEWTKYALPGATLWFWNTEIGWANIHPILNRYGWIYKGTNTWNKTIRFAAGNTNTKTLTKFPVVTEICVQYILPHKFFINDEQVSEKEWLRSEWKRTGLPFSEANIACDVKSAATRKYLSSDHLWYSPPKNAFEKLVNYANKNGKKTNIPYFSIDKERPLTAEEWENIHPYFNLKAGITNVWDVPQLSGKERIRIEGKNKSLHNNQKPLQLMERIIEASSKESDMIWEPFGGLCSAVVAAQKLKRRAVAAEINPEMYEFAKNRLKIEQLSLF